MILRCLREQAVLEGEDGFGTELEVDAFGDAGDANVPCGVVVEFGFEGEIVGEGVCGAGVRVEETLGGGEGFFRR